MIHFVYFYLRGKRFSFLLFFFFSSSRALDTRESNLISIVTHFICCCICFMLTVNVYISYFFSLSLLYPYFSDSFPMRYVLYQVHLCPVYLMRWEEL